MAKSSWKESGDGKHTKVQISGRDQSITHVRSRDSRYGSDSKITSVTKNSKSEGRTTVHGNDHVNKHGNHK